MLADTFAAFTTQSTLAADPWMGAPEDFDRFVRCEATQAMRLASKAGIMPEQALGQPRRPAT